VDEDLDARIERMISKRIPKAIEEHINNNKERGKK